MPLTFVYCVHKLIMHARVGSTRVGACLENFKLKGKAKTCLYGLPMCLFCCCVALPKPSIYSFALTSMCFAHCCCNSCSGYNTTCGFHSSRKGQSYITWWHNKIYLLLYRLCFLCNFWKTFLQLSDVCRISLSSLAFYRLLKKWYKNDFVITW